ncbi:TetR/AcrR family transcriptional regulator [Microbacterium atlanticum]|uniref:TetR/AcrR family transcriptional regulator n=1 Tax=Microbacterium atlanticum TaxID=2782168 RepID=UPI00188788EE|nr:TetR/AcrR family transcriptional regulator [Microbacterium atlanticum]
MLEAAVDIAARDGQAAVTLRSVADAAGVAHSLVRHHFGTRHALMTEALLMRSKKDIAGLVADNESIEGFFGNLEHQLTDERRRGDLSRLLIYDYILAGIRGEYEIEPVREQQEVSVEGIGAQLAALGVSDGDLSLARLVIAVADGLALQHMLLDSPETTTGILARLREVLQLVADAQR